MSETQIPMSSFEDTPGTELESPVGDEEKQILAQSKVKKVIEKKKRLYTFKEPETHLKNRSLISTLCESCCNRQFKTDLSPHELILFYKIKEAANTTFDSKSTEYDHLFNQLYENLTQETTPGELVNEKWKEYGFQNANPRSDFRGAGLLSLRQLIRFVGKNRGRTLRMCEPKHEFCFAICSINVSYFLIRYYHLADGMTYDKDKTSICSRIALKNFCQMLENDEETLDRMHGMLLNDLFEIWVELRKRVKGITLLDFSMAADSMKKRFIKTTGYNFFSDFDHLRRQYNLKYVDFPTERPSLMMRKI